MTQYPLPTTIADFWTMIHCYECSSVVLLDDPQVLYAVSISQNITHKCRLFYMPILMMEKFIISSCRRILSIKYICRLIILPHATKLLGVSI